MHPEQTRVDAIRRKLYRAVADARADNDRPALDRHDELEATADAYARTVSASNDRGHSVDGTTPQERADGFSGVRENLLYTKAHGTRPGLTAESAVETWLNSDHRKNLLHKEPRLHGLGLRLSGDSLVVCHLFARREKVGVAGRVRSALGI